MIKPAIDVKFELLHRSPALFVGHMHKLADAILRNDNHEADRQTEALAQVLSRSMMLSDLMGRKRVLVEHDVLAKKPGRVSAFHEGYQAMAMLDSSIYVARFDSLPGTGHFDEAIDDILSREPRLAKSTDDMRRVYATHGFAVRGLPARLAASTRLKLTEQIQLKTAELSKQGVSYPEAGKVLAAIGGFTQAYGETVFRTNQSNAFTAGRFKQLEDPDVRAVTPALEYDAVGDSSTRKNHEAGTGLLADSRSRVWDRHSPPQGFNCRCDVRVVDIFELKDRGLWKNGKVTTFYPSTFSRAYPDPGFKVERTDKRIYG